MSDLDSRLRADAKREVQPPDFDTAMQAAANTRHRPFAAIAAAAAAVVLVGSGATALAVHHAGSSDIAAGKPPHGRFQPRQTVPYTGTIFGGIAAERSSRPNQLMLVASKPGDPPNTCSYYSARFIESTAQVRVVSRVNQFPSGALEPALPRTSVKVVTSPSGVKVAVGGPPESGDPSPGPTASRCGTPADDPNVEGVFELKHPLGNRTLIDDRTGLPIPVFESHAPQPGHLPVGYKAYPDQDFAPMAAFLGDLRPGSLTPISVGRFYHRSTDDGEGIRLDVVAAPSDNVVAGATVIDHATVDGHPATVTETAHTRCVTWTPSSNSGLQVCTDNADQPTSDLLGEDELLAVANSLP